MQSLSLKSVKKKFKSQKFAAAIEREEIERALVIFGVEFAPHTIDIIDALKPHADELGI